jgi:hypothetical protein
MLLTHYSPDLPAFLVEDVGEVGPRAARAACPAPGLPQDCASYALDEAVILDFGGRLARLQPTAHSYRDLSPEGCSAAAARAVFESLRWAEQRAAEGGRVVLLPDLTLERDSAAEAADSTAAAAGEHAPALADRLFRAASGKSASLSTDDTRVLVQGGTGA